jgi:hypothetical protein
MDWETGAVIKDRRNIRGIPKNQITNHQKKKEKYFNCGKEGYFVKKYRNPKKINQTTT